MKIIIISILVPILISIFSFLYKKIFKRWIWKIFKLDFGIRWYYSFWKKKKIYIFFKKQKTRVSVSVLARIEFDGKFLLKWKKPEPTRQDSLYKPLGGAIKITENMGKILKDFEYDIKTKYSSKNNDFRIFKDLKNNKIIHKALYNEKLSFYHKELIREIKEELKIKKKIFDKLFSFKQNSQPTILPFYTEANFSILRENDYVHHIIFDLKIKEKEELDKILKKNNDFKWLDLKEPGNIAITSYILDIKKTTQPFKNGLNK